MMTDTKDKKIRHFILIPGAVAFGILFLGSLISEILIRLVFTYQNTYLLELFIQQFQTISSYITVHSIKHPLSDTSIIPKLIEYIR